MALAEEVSELAQGLMSGVPDDDVVADFDFHQLSRANQVARDFYVRLRWRGLPARMCRSTTAAAAVMTATRNTSRGCTRMVSSVPMETM